MKEEFEDFRRGALQWVGNISYNIAEEGLDYEGKYVLKINFRNNGFKWVTLKCGGYKTASMILSFGKPKQQYYNDMGYELYNLGNKYRAKLDFTYSDRDVVLVYVDVNYSDPGSFFSAINRAMREANADIEKLMSKCE